MKETEIARLKVELHEKLSKWGLGDALDEVVDDTLSRFWESSQKAEIRKPICWMLRTAKNVRREIERRRASSPLVEEELCDPEATRLRLPQIDLSRSKAWLALSSQQRYVLRETIMFDRPVAAVAREVGVNRSTAKSWKERLPSRLANDKFIEKYLGDLDGNFKHLVELCRYASNN